MRSSKSILSIAVALALSVMPGLASPSKGASATKSRASDNNATKKFEGKVVTMEADTLVVRLDNGKKDEVFKIDSSTIKGAGVSPGSEVTVNYRKDNSRYVATDIELSGTN